MSIHYCIYYIPSNQAHCARKNYHFRNSDSIKYLLYRRRPGQAPHPTTYRHLVFLPPANPHLQIQNLFSLTKYLHLSFCLIF